MAENETVEFALCFKCKKHGDFVLQPDGMWQCPNCHSLREIATTKKEGDLANSSDSTMNKVIFVSASFKSVNSYQIDGIELTRKIRGEIERLNNNGYEIVSVTPVTSGKYNYEQWLSYGYSYTEGVIILARKV